MYLSKDGKIKNSFEIQEKMKKFNDNLRQQYREQHSNIPVQSTSPKNQSEKAFLSPDNFQVEEWLIIALILLLFLEDDKDYILIGALAALLLLTN